MSEEVYKIIGQGIVWLVSIGFSILCVSVAAVLFDSWILRPRREALMKAGQLEATGHILRNCYWFSEHPPTMNLLRAIVKVYSEGQGSTVDQIREDWRKEMRDHGRTTTQGD